MSQEADDFLECVADCHWYGVLLIKSRLVNAQADAPHSTLYRSAKSPDAEISAATN